MIDKSVPSTALMFGRDPLGFGAPLMDPALPAVLHCYGKRSSGAGLTGSFTLAVGDFLQVTDSIYFQSDVDIILSFSFVPNMIQ